MLTDAKCRAAKPAEKPYKISDEKGLYLHVSTTGFRSWRWKYRFARKEKRLTFGGYPEVSLAAARTRRDEARSLLRQGVDPTIHQKQRAAQAKVEAASTFETFALEWLEMSKPRWTEIYASNVTSSLKDHVFPEIGSLPIRSITAPMVLSLIRKLEKQGKLETSRRVRSRISAIFSTAIAAGLADNDPAAPIKALMVPATKGRFPAITNLKEARAFLADAESIPASPVTRLASRLLALTAVRPGVIRFTPWEEFDAIDPVNPVWHLSAARMKLRMDRKAQDRFDFLVPLARQSMEIIAELRRLTGRGPMAFPNERWAHRPMSENAIGFLYNRLPSWRGRHVPHGWRSTFSTVMNERAALLDRLEDRPIIDLMLAHLPGDIESLYNRSAYLRRRRELAQEWADILLEGLPPASALLEGPRR